MISQDVAKQKLAEHLENGRTRSAQVVENLMKETASRVDVVVPRTTMNFHVTPKTLTLDVTGDKLPGVMSFTDWSRGQMLSTLGIQNRFVQGLQDDGQTGAEIATDVLNRLRYRIGGEEEANGKARRLLRVVDNQVRGWLSPTYGIFDQSEIIGGFAKAIQSVGGKEVVFTNGVISDRRYGVTAIYNRLFEPFPNEWILIGAQLQSSDYGFGAVDLVQQVIRLVCNNGALGISMFRKIHRGRGFEGGDDHAFEVSEKTRQLSAAATVSLLTDGVRGAFGDKAIDRALNSYQLAAAKTITPENETKSLRKDGIIGKEDGEAMEKMIGMDLEVLPNTDSKNSALRWGQLLSYMAGQQENGEKQIVMSEAAGKYFMPQALN